MTAQNGAAFACIIIFLNASRYHTELHLILFNLNPTISLLLLLFLKRHQRIVSAQIRGQ